MPTHLLDAAFRATTYKVAGGNRVFSLRIGTSNPAFDEFLTSHSVRCWGIVTAQNPGGRRNAEKDNTAAQMRMQKVLEAARWPFLEAINHPDTDEWPVEPSFCVLNVGKDELLMLADAFDQLAIVFANALNPPQLLWTHRPQELVRPRFPRRLNGLL